MNISQDTLEVIQFLDEITGNGLRKRNDMSVILEIGALTGNYELIDDLLFHGKYLWNLHATISKAGSTTEGIDKLHKEYRDTAMKLSGLLAQLLDDGDDDDKTRFGDIYFVKTTGAFKNLIDLCHDLSKLKEVQTTMKGRE